MKLFKKNKKNVQDNFLEYIPCKRHKTWEVNKNGNINLIFYHDKLVEKFMRWLVKKPYKSDIELDELGSTVWNLVNGKNNVFDIGKKLTDEYGDKCQPVYDRLIMYLRYLNRRGWIYFERGNQLKGGV